MLPWILAAALLGVGGPDGQITIESGEIEATMGHANAWTIVAMECDGMPVTVNSGGQGAVVNPQDGDWTGGAMGGNAEQVQSLTINGDLCTVVPQETLSGTVTVVKEATLAGIEHTSTTVFDDGVIRQTNAFTFAEETNLSAFYPFIYSFSPEFTHWLALPDTGASEPGEFTADGGHRINAEVSAFALYNQPRQRGIVVYLQKSPGGAVTLWDQTGYRKFWVQPTRGPISADSTFEGTMLLTCFEAGDDWQVAARRTAAELQEAHPMQDTEARANELYDEGIPEAGFMTAKTENLTVVFEAPSAWTIDQIHWKDFMVAGPTGHFGTVLIPREEGGNWIGTGHSEGGREIVHALNLRVDGEERPVQTATTFEGEEIELSKRSTIHKFDAQHTVTVTSSEIVQHALLTATEAHGLSRMYLFMNCIEPATTAWIAELPDGSLAEGIFESDGGFELERPARWAAQWFPEQNLSVLQYLTRIPRAEGSKLRLWDQERYHKFYVQYTDGASIAEDEMLDFTLVFTIVEGETGDWAATRAAAEALKAAYPPVDEEQPEK